MKIDKQKILDFLELSSEQQIRELSRMTPEELNIAQMLIFDMYKESQEKQKENIRAVKESIENNNTKPLVSQINKTLQSISKDIKEIEDQARQIKNRLTSNNKKGNKKWLN